ncbi:hypothetical protein [Corynebacterium macginleyi]|uniref:hypothetical protein n=2 Tax=Corynebacterium macginleyi TaxID=38290 RepID=UPI00190BE3DA|nr:hypothetical protein [Corynebacterium macginleyi]
MGWSAKPLVLSLAVPLGIKSKSHLITHHLSIAEELTTALADYMAGKAPQAELASGDEGNTPAKEALDRLVTSDEFVAQWWNAVYSAGALGCCDRLFGSSVVTFW